ncbi:MAG TPA: hypothetical protein VMT00_02730 [Thermoanaerobaculia bacterium]|nr:hypothetical protein [Thermoanaerobaculia bacterium]
MISRFRFPCLPSLTIALAVFSFPLIAADLPTLPIGAEKAAETIRRNVVEAPVRILASDLFEGRGPASRGDELTQLYLSNELRQLGLLPAAADGTYRQPFEIVGITSEVPKSWSFRGRSGELTLGWWDDFIAASGVLRRQDWRTPKSSSWVMESKRRSMTGMISKEPI